MLHSLYSEEESICYAVFTLYVVFYRIWLKGDSFFITLLTLYVVFCWICSIDESPCACITFFFFYTLNIVFCRICLIDESPYITFFIYFVCCISQDWACSMGKYLCITVFIYFVVCYSILPDIFNRSISINQTLLTIAMSVVFLKKWSKRNISMSDNLSTI